MTDLLTIAIRAARAVPVVAATGTMRVSETADTAAANGVRHIPLLHPFMRSFAYRVLSRSALLMIARIAIELAAGRNAITHRQFIAFGINRGRVTHAQAELEALGLIRVRRQSGPVAAEFDISDKWREIRSLAEAVQIRNRARHFGITRRRKVERAAARRERARCMEQIRAALDAPQSVPALSVLDDDALKTLQTIVAATASGRSVNYTGLCDHVGIGRNTLASKLRVLVGLGFITITNGRRCAVYKLTDQWRVVNIEQAEDIVTAARASRKNRVPRGTGSGTASLVVGEERNSTHSAGFREGVAS